jgi:hypothetical protein
MAGFIEPTKYEYITDSVVSAWQTDEAPAALVKVLHPE